MQLSIQGSSKQVLSCPFHQLFVALDALDALEMRGSQEPIDLLARHAAGSHIRVASQPHALAPLHQDFFVQMREVSFDSEDVKQ